MRSRHTSVSLDNKNGLVVNTIFLALLSQPIVSLQSVVEQSLADLFCRKQEVLAHDAFQRPPFFLITAVINPVGIKEKNVPRTHQCQLRPFRGLCSPLWGFQRQVAVAIRMIFWNLQAEW